MTETRELFDTAVELEQRLEALVEWVAARRGEPVAKAEQILLASMLGAGAASLPLHLIFPNEPEMDVTLLNPTWVEPEVQCVDSVLESAFIWRHSAFSEEEVEGLQQAMMTYQCLIGVMDWDAVFETRAEYEAAVHRYEVLARSTDGIPVLDEDEFWYIAVRDGGYTREQADEFSRLQLIYQYLKGVAEDEVGTSVMGG